MALDLARGKEIFRVALGIAPASEQRAYVVEACGMDEELRNNLLAMLEVHAIVATPVPSGSTQDLPTKPGSDSEPDLLAHGDIIAGRYKIIELIKDGGMGSVYRAHRITEKMEVALKVIKPGMDTRQVLARFNVEKQAMALMKHDNIGRFLDAGMTDAGRPFFVMELVKGLPFAEYGDDAKLAIRQRLELFVKVCDAVQHAHQKGIVHRDLKPGNVLVGLYDQKPVPKVIDFGLAKALHHPLTDDADITVRDAFLGTWRYASPEQVQPNNLDVDTRTDVYSLGVMLYELLTGETPLDGPRLKLDEGEKRKIICEEEPPRPSAKIRTSAQLATLAKNRATEPLKLVKQVRGELDLVTMKALAKNRGERYGSPSELAAEIQRHLNGETVLVVPPSYGYRISKAIKKHKGKVLIASVLAATIVLGSVVSTIGWAKAYREKERANQEKERANLEKDRANLENDRANRQAAIAKAVNEFLNELLSEVDPTVQVKPDQAFVSDIGLKRVLARAAERVGVRFRDKPLVEASLRHTIGNTYVGMGDFKAARVHLERAEQLRQRILGADDPDRLNSLHELGLLLFADGQFDLSQQLLREVLDVRTRTLGTMHPDTWKSRYAVALLLESQGKPAEARAIYEELLSLQKKALTLHHRDTLSTQRELAGLIQAAEPERAQAMLREALDVQREVLGAEHPETFVTLNKLALLHDERKNRGEALRLFSELVKNSETALGPDHPRHLVFRANRAMVLSKGRESAIEADQEYKDVTARLRRACGPTHDDTLGAIQTYATWLAFRERYEEAEPLFKEAYEGCRQRSDVSAENVETLLGNIIHMYEKWNKPDEVHTWRRKLAQEQQKASGASKPSR